MKGNQLKKRSIVTRIFFLLMIVIFSQAMLSWNTLLSTNIATRVESYSYNGFTRTLVNRANNIESFMSTSWSNISDISVLLSQEHTLMLEGRAELTEAEKLVFLNNSVEAIVQMMTKTGTTGGFVILDDGEDLKYSYSTVYLKSYDSGTQVVNSENLMLARGPAEVSKEHGFSLVSNWSYGIFLDEETLPILKIPMEASEITKSVEYLGYWHISKDISNEKLNVLTCSMPFFDENGQAVGVVGIEVSQEYFYKFLPEIEFGNQGSYGYILAENSSKSGDVFVSTMLNGSVQSELLPLGTEINLSPIDFEEQELDVVPKLLELENQTLCVYYEPLEIYTNNSPYQEHEIYIMGMVDLKNITSFTDEFWEVIKFMFMVSLGAGICISYIVGRMVARPIILLNRAVSSFDIQDKFQFKETNIQEIDDLSFVITQMQENILRSATRTDKILELLNKGVGSFEYEKDAELVTVSDAIYKMLELEEYHGIPIPKSVFIQRLEELKTRPVEEISHTYAFGEQDVKYYKVEEFHQNQVVLGVVEDATKDVEDLLVLNYERNYDPLTGIYNRRAFHQKLAEVLRVENLKIAGFVMFDLDNLKYVNDTFGHDSGDVYIKTAATTINSCLCNYGVVGRMSGDEFYAFLYGFDTKESLRACLDELYLQFDREPIEMPNATEFKIRVSGGIAWYGDDSKDLEELKKFADFAMYIGKHTVKGQLREFDKEMYLKESYMLNGKAELNRVLDNELLDFVFQPIIDVSTGGIFGYEALMRPQSEDLATPLKFLQLAGLEGKLWKVEKLAIFKTLSLYREYGSLFGDAKLFINSIPSESLKEEDFLEINRLYGDILNHIVIEITEQEQSGDSFMEEKLQKLHTLKVDIALDDYGSGYANDIGLVKIQPDIVKIDRSLISNVHVDPSRQNIVHKIISFCKEQNICVLAEGIETEKELEYLVEAGIQLAQGYYISRPMYAPDFDVGDIQKKLLELKSE